MIRIFAPKNTGAFAFFPFIFILSEEYKKDDVFIRHEIIHIRQQAEMVLLIFLLWYTIEFIVRFVQYRNPDKAYRNISFEREAYAHENEAGYLKTRKFWGFLKYM